VAKLVFPGMVEEWGVTTFRGRSGVGRAGSLELPGNELLEGFDASFIPFVERPLLNAPGLEQAGLAQYLEVFTCCGLTDAKFLGYEYFTDSILDEISVHLWREVGRGILEPLQDLNHSFTREGSCGCRNCHIVN
jgi:hypothetical protein